MKKLMLFLLLVPLTSDLSLNEITRAISNGDAPGLEPFMDNSVEIAVMNKEDIYPKAQAISILKDFFARHQPQSFSQVHQGASKAKDSMYCIGNLKTNSETFRVYIYMRVDQGQHFIQELRFDEE